MDDEQEKKNSNSGLPEIKLYPCACSSKAVHQDIIDYSLPESTSQVPNYFGIEHVIIVVLLLSYVLLLHLIDDRKKCVYIQWQLALWSLGKRTGKWLFLLPLLLSPLPGHDLRLFFTASRLGCVQCSCIQVLFHITSRSWLLGILILILTLWIWLDDLKKAAYSQYMYFISGVNLRRRQVIVNMGVYDGAEPKYHVFLTSACLVNFIKLRDHAKVFLCT